MVYSDSIIVVIIDWKLNVPLKNTNIKSKAKLDMWDGIRNSYRAKHINDSRFIEDLVKWW